MKNAEIAAQEINHPTNQGGSSAHGRRVSGGGVGKAESQVNARQIDQPETKRTWPAGGQRRCVESKDWKHAHERVRSRARAASTAAAGGIRGERHRHVNMPHSATILEPPRSATN
jgi:hypothetical protein